MNKIIFRLITASMLSVFALNLNAAAINTKYSGATTCWKRYAKFNAWVRAADEALVRDAQADSLKEILINADKLIENLMYDLVRFETSTNDEHAEETYAALKKIILDTATLLGKYRDKYSFNKIRITSLPYNMLQGAISLGDADLVNYLLIQNRDDCDILLQHQPELLFNLTHKALTSGSLEIVALLLKNGPGVNHFVSRINCLLMQAVRLGNLAMVELLLDNGAQAHHTNAAKENPLYMAIREQRPEIVRLLLKRGAQAQEIAPHGDLLVRFAIEMGQQEAFQLLMPHILWARANNLDAQALVYYAIKTKNTDFITPFFDVGDDYEALKEKLTRVPIYAGYFNLIDDAIKCQAIDKAKKDTLAQIMRAIYYLKTEPMFMPIKDRLRLEERYQEKLDALLKQHVPAPTAASDLASGSSVSPQGSHIPQDRIGLLVSRKEAKPAKVTTKLTWLSYAGTLGQDPDFKPFFKAMMQLRELRVERYSKAELSSNETALNKAKRIRHMERDFSRILRRAAENKPNTFSAAKRQNDLGLLRTLFSSENPQNEVLLQGLKTGAYGSWLGNVSDSAKALL